MGSTKWVSYLRGKTCGWVVGGLFSSSELEIFPFLQYGSHNVGKVNSAAGLFSRGVVLLCTATYLLTRV